MTPFKHISVKTVKILTFLKANVLQIDSVTIMSFEARMGIVHKLSITLNSSFQTK